MPRKKKVETEESSNEQSEESENKTEEKKKISNETSKAKKSEESKKIDESKKSKLAELKEKAKELEKKVEEAKEIGIKKKIGEEVQVETLVPIEEYLKSSIHLGTRVITPDMRPFVYKRRADGLAVFNTALLDKKIREAADFLAQFNPEDIIIVCKREAGWKALELFSSVTGIRIFTKKYPAGILTNPNLEDFFEVDLVVICDPWLDKNAFNDALRIKIPILAICDTNNYVNGVKQVLPGNNKSSKSLGMIFYLLAKLYSEKKKLKVKIPEISEWIEGWENLEPPK